MTDVSEAVGVDVAVFPTIITEISDAVVVADSSGTVAVVVATSDAGVEAEGMASVAGGHW